jgi:hypothetical protein
VAPCELNKAWLPRRRAAVESALPERAVILALIGLCNQASLHVELVGTLFEYLKPRVLGLVGVHFDRGA